MVEDWKKVVSDDCHHHRVGLPLRVNLSMRVDDVVVAVPAEPRKRRDERDEGKEGERRARRTTRGKRTRRGDENGSGVRELLWVEITALSCRKFLKDSRLVIVH